MKLLAISTLSLCGFAILVLASPAAAQLTFYVDVHATPPGNGTLAAPFPSIQQAIAQAPHGSTVSVAPGTYVENVTLWPLVNLVSQQGPLATVIRPANAGSVISMGVWCDCASTSPKLDGFTITGVFGPSGTSAIQCGEGLVVNCILTGNTGNGYFAYTSDWDGFLENCTVAGNDNGVRVAFLGIAYFTRIALQNAGANYTAAGLFGNFSACVGTGLPAASGNQLVDPGFWDFSAGDYHLLPGSPASAVPGGGHAGALPYDPNYTPSSFAFCFGDGALTDHTTVCPCGNSGAAGRGCASGANPSGALLMAGGQAYLDDVVLYGSGMPASAFGLYLQHDAADDRVFHDGVLCAGGNLLRLRSRTANLGASQFPDPMFANDATLTLSQRGFVTPGSGAVRYYSVFYRSPAATFCPPATANVTNGWTIAW